MRGDDCHAADSVEEGGAAGSGHGECDGVFALDSVGELHPTKERCWLVS